jgi:hypothetical protein
MQIPLVEVIHELEFILGLEIIGEAFQVKVHGLEQGLEKKHPFLPTFSKERGVNERRLPGLAILKALT